MARLHVGSDQVEIKTGYRPGIFGAMISMNSDFYIRQHGFSSDFEAYVASELAQYWQGFEEGADEIVFAQANGPIVGGLILEADRLDSRQLRLRWFIVGNSCRGTGIGRRLLGRAIKCARDKNAHSICLDGFDRSHAASHLYKSMGFIAQETSEFEQFSTLIPRTHFRLELKEHQ